MKHKIQTYDITNEPTVSGLPAVTLSFKTDSPDYSEIPLDRLILPRPLSAHGLHIKRAKDNVPIRPPTIASSRMTLHAAL